MISNDLVTHFHVSCIYVSQILYSWQKSDTLSPEFVDRRRAGLENFLLRVAAHPGLCRDTHFLGFLQMEHGWRETVMETGL